MDPFVEAWRLYCEATRAATWAKCFHALDAACGCDHRGSDVLEDLDGRAALRPPVGYCFALPRESRPEHAWRQGRLRSREDGRRLGVRLLFDRRVCRQESESGAGQRADEVEAEISDGVCVTSSRRPSGRGMSRTRRSPRGPAASSPARGERLTAPSGPAHSPITAANHRVDEMVRVVPAPDTIVGIYRVPEDVSERRQDEQLVAPNRAERPGAAAA